VPTLNDAHGYHIDERKYNLTVLYFNALAIYCIPSELIKLDERFSVVSVCVDT
jgi:hypothetical protein